MTKELFEIKNTVFEAISNGNLELVQEFNQDIKKILSNGMGNGFLIKAASHGQVEIFNYITEEFYCSDSDYLEAANSAARFGHVEILKILDYRALNFSSLISAIQGRQLEAVKFILRLNITDSKLKDAINRSGGYGSIPITDFLIKRYVEMFGSRPNISISEAASAGDLKMVKFLFGLDEKESTDILLYSSFSPVDEAAKNGHVDVVKFLIEKGGNYDSRAVKILLSNLTGLTESREKVLDILTVYSVHTE